MKNHVVLKSNTFKFWNEDDPAWKRAGPFPPPRDFVKHLMKELSLKGVHFAAGGPIEGSSEWVLHPQIHGNCFQFEILWATSIASDGDYWLIRFFENPPSSLNPAAGTRNFDADICALASLIRECLDVDEKENVVSSVQWLTEKEFWESFVC